MKKIKSFFDKIKNRNIVFVLSLVVCAGVISFVAFGMNGAEGNAIKIDNSSETLTTTVTWYKAGPELYELNSQYGVFQKVSATTVKASVSKNTEKTALKNKKITTQTTASAVTIGKGTVKTTVIKKVKRKISTTVTSKPAKITKKKKKKKKRITTTTQTTTVTTKAYTPSKAKANTYSTRDISEEKYTVKSITTGKKIKSDGFDILCQIVNGEIGSTWNEEAIKAQAVAAYTYLRYCKEKGITAELGVKSGYDSRLEKIVKSVEGLVCTYDGSLIDAVFCASTAGCTADCSNVWGGSYPYLKSVDSKYDADYDPNYGVTKTIAKADVKKILQKQGVKLSTKKKNWIKVLSNYNGKYVGDVSIDGQITLTGTKIRSLFELKSAAFTVKYSNKNFIFTTYGYGHGVGMSQWGAQLYASKSGYKFDQILKHYYSGIDISLSQEI